VVSTLFDRFTFTEDARWCFYKRTMCCHVTFTLYFFFIGSYYIYIWITLLMYRDRFICCLLIVYI
jgi:hypothetical protein